jgi:hypothetical protein
MKIYNSCANEVQPGVIKKHKRDEKNLSCHVFHFL